MNRRGFFSALAAVAATAALDPDRLLWVPGKKLISIAKPAFLAVGDIVTFSDWPERYIVTGAAQSIEMIHLARFARSCPNLEAPWAMTVRVSSDRFKRIHRA